MLISLWTGLPADVDQFMDILLSDTAQSMDWYINLWTGISIYGLVYQSMDWYTNLWTVCVTGRPTSIYGLITGICTYCAVIPNSRSNI